MMVLVGGWGGMDNEGESGGLGKVWIMRVKVGGLEEVWIMRVNVKCCSA